MKPGADIADTVNGPMELDLFILQNYVPRRDAKNRYRWCRRDNGSQVTWPRSEYFIAFRDIYKVAQGKDPYSVQQISKPRVRRMSVPVDEDDLKYLRKPKAAPKRELRWDDPDDRMALKYREVCRRLERARAEGQLS